MRSDGHALLIIDKAETEQSTAFGSIRVIVKEARNEYDDALLRAKNLASASGDRTTSLGQFTALAQLLDDTAHNLSESYEVAIDGGRFRDAARKEQFRGLLQRSLVEYAQIVMALDELTQSMQKEWRVEIDLKTKVPPLELRWDRAPASGVMSSAGSGAVGADDDAAPGSASDRATTASAGKRGIAAKGLAAQSMQPVSEPAGLADEIRSRLPTAAELETMRNAVNLPEPQVRAAKNQYLKRIYAAYGPDKWSVVDVNYLMAMNDALTSITGLNGLELPRGYVSGGDASHFLAQRWILQSRDPQQFVERVKALDPKTRQRFDAMVSDREIKDWLLLVVPPLDSTAAKSQALDAVIQAGVLARGVVDLRRSIQAGQDGGR